MSVLCSPEPQRDAAHLLGKARHLARGNGKRRLGRDVAPRRTRAARGEDEVAADVVGELAQRVFDLATVVGNEPRVDLNGGRDGVPAPGLQGGNAFVPVLAPACAVGHGHQAENEFIRSIADCAHDQDSSSELLSVAFSRFRAGSSCS